MNDIVDTFSAQALKIAAQYEGGQVAFADLTGLVDEFAATLTEQLSDLPESQRPPVTTALESRLDERAKELNSDSRSVEALNEILLSLNRTPIY